MKTRQEYLDGKCTHEEYYNQFVDSRVKQIVLTRHTKEDLKKAYSKDESLNSISIRVWDSLAENIRYKGPELKEVGDYLTLSGSVCILKAAARQIIED